MQVVDIKIENKTEEIQNVELMNLEDNSGVELSYTVNEVDYFKGISFKSLDNDIIHKCFEGGRIFIDRIPVYVNEWLNVEKIINNQVTVPLLLNNTESIYFKLNPKCRLEVKMALNLELEKKLKKVKT